MIENKEYVITREFNAPRDLVYKVWTDPQHFSRWYGPKGVTVTRAELDIRLGGVSYVSMQGSQGPALSVKWTYQEVIPPRRLAWVGNFIDEKDEISRHPFVPTWPQQIRTEVDFEEKGNRTLVTFKWIPVNATPEEMEAFVKGFDGVTAGWKSAFEKLDVHLQESK